MSGSFYRQSPVKAAFIDSLMITPPQSLADVTDALNEAASAAEWAAWEPSAEMLADAEAKLGKAYRAVVAWRGR